MAFGALMLHWSIPPSDHLLIASGMFHRLPPICPVTPRSPSVYHILPYASSALTVFFAKCWVIWVVRNLCTCAQATLAARAYFLKAFSTERLLIGVLYF